MSENKMSYNRSLLWILLSTLLISGSAFTGWLYFLHLKERRLHDDQYRIVAIIQSSTDSVDTLKSVYLAELLDLSLDKPKNLYQFNIKQGISALLNNPLIRSATIKKILPGKLWVHYQLRKPIAYVGDYANTAIDEEGILFPFKPFYTPKKIPTIYFGMDKQGLKWGDSLEDNNQVKLAFSVLNYFEHLKLNSFEIKYLDVTQAQSDSYGLRQIVITIVDRNEHKAPSTIFLRLNVDHFPQNLDNFKNLMDEKQQSINQNESYLYTIIDLRIPHLGFIKSIKN